MLLYTSFTSDIFDILVNLLRCMQPINYYSGWHVNSLQLEDTDETAAELS